MIYFNVQSASQRLKDVWCGDVVLRLSLVQLILWSCFFYAFSAAIPIISHQTGWAVENLFLALTVGFLLWAVFSPVAGRFVDAGAAFTTIRVSIIVGSVLLFVISLSSSAYIVYGCMAMVGIVNAFLLYDPFFALIIRNSPDKDRADRAILKMTLIAGMATFIAYPAVIFLQPLWGWRGVFMGLGLATLTTLFILPKTFFKQHTYASPAIQNSSMQISFRHVWRCVLIGTCFGFIVLSHTILIFQLPIILSPSDGGGFAAALLFLVGPAQVLGRLFFPTLKRHLSIEAIGIFAIGIMICASGVIWATNASLIFLPVALLCQGMAYGLNTVLRAIMTGQYFDKNILGKVMGIVAMIGVLFMALSPTVGGYLLLQLGFHLMFAFIIGFEMVSIALLCVCMVCFKKK